MFLLVVYLPYLGSLPLLHEEPRRALIARTMMQSGDYFVPMLLSEVYTAKPPLYNWLIVFFSQFAGEVSVFTARLPSVVFLFLTAVLMVVGLKSYLGFRTRVFLGFAILLAPEMIAKANIAEIEIVFTFFVSLSIWSWFWLYDKGKTGFALWLLPLFIVGLSFLTKREPSIVFFYFSIVPFLFVKKQFRELFSIGHIVSFIVMLAMIGSWLSLMIDEVGVDALLHSLQSEVINRGITSSVLDYIKHILIYPVKLFFAMFPFAILLLLLISKQSRTECRSRYQDLFVFVLLAVIANLPLYWFRGDAAVRYYLPMFPTMLVLAAMVFESFVEKRFAATSDKWMTRAVQGCSVLLVLLSVGLLASAFLSFKEAAPVPLLPWYVVLMVAIPVMIASLYYSRMAFSNAVSAVLPVLLGVMIVVKLLFISAYLPDKMARINESRNGELIMQQVNKLTGNARVQVVGHVHYSLWFYAIPDKLLVPSRLTANESVNYKGYFMGYASTPKMQKLSNENNWQEVSRIIYRDQTIIVARMS